MNIVDAIHHEHLFAPLFKSPSWLPWQSCHKAIFGLPMNATDLALYTECTGRTTPPTKPFKEV